MNLILIATLSLLLLVPDAITKKSSSKSKSDKSHSHEVGWEKGTVTFVDVDVTLIAGKYGSDVVDAALDTIDLTCVFDDDKLLLRRMALALTNDGKDEETYLGGSDGGGIWKIPQSVFDQTKSASELEAYRSAVKTSLGIDWSKVTLEDLTKPVYSALAAKLFLQLVPDIPRTISGQAALIDTEFVLNETGVAAEIQQTLEDEPDTSCSSARLDVILILDGSGSVKSENFDKVRSFTRRFVDAVEVGSDYTRIGVIQYSNKVQVEFDLDDYNNKADAKEAVNDIVYLTGSTDTAAALRKAKDMFPTGETQVTGDGGQAVRPGVPKIAVVLTDGKSNDEKATALAAASLRAAGVGVFAVGIGSGVDQAEINAIASEPDCSHTFRLTSFSEIEDFVEQIRRSACKEPGQYTLGTEVFRTLEAGEKMYLTLAAKVAKGIKIDLSTYKGQVEIYLSTKTKNPNSASHQWKCRGNMNERGTCFIPPGHLKKLIKSSNQEIIQLYASLAADDDELARFYFAMVDSSSRHAASLLTAVCLVVANFLIS